MFRKHRSEYPQFFISQKVEIRKSSVHGLGVFAKEDIEKWEMIEAAPVILFDSATQGYLYDLYDRRHILMDYPFGWTNDGAVLAIAMGYGGVYNHSTYGQNIQWIANRELECLEFTASRDIQMGEELFVMYVNSLDQDRLWFLTQEEDEEDQRASRGEDLVHPGGSLGHFRVREMRHAYDAEYVLKHGFKPGTDDSKEKFEKSYDTLSKYGLKPTEE